MRSLLQLIGRTRLVAAFMLAAYVCGPSTSAARAQERDQSPRSVTRGRFDPWKQKPIVRDKGGVRLRLVNGVDCDDCAGYFNTRWAIEVERGNRAARPVNVVGPVQVDDVRIVDQSRAVLIGRILGDVAGVVIFRIDTGDVIDKFVGYDPDVSPDGQWIAFVKVFPRHFMEGVSSMYLLYNTARPPSYHRQANVSADDEVDVGLPLYPLDARNVPGDNLLVIANLRHWMSSDGFFWSDDGTTLVFSDRENAAQSLVVVDLALLQNTPRQATPPLGISVLPLDHTAIVDATKCQTFAGLEGDAFSVSNLEFLNERSVRVRFDSLHQCLKLSTLEVELPR